jgi:hypothetical protein
MKDELILDLIHLLEKIDKAKPKQRKEMILSIIEKYSKKPEPEIEISYSDFQNAISYAKNQYSTIPFPIRIGNKSIDIEEQANYCMFLAVIAYLNNKEILKKTPIFQKGK